MTKRVHAVVFAVGRRAVVLGTDRRCGRNGVVFDPSNYEQAVRGFIQLQQQYAQLVTTYQLLESEQSQTRARGPEPAAIGRLRHPI